MDLMSVYVDNQDGSNRRTLAFLVEYTPPHKLSLTHWGASLADLESKDFLTEVTDKAVIPTELDAQFEYEAKAGRAGADADVRLHDPSGRKWSRLHSRAIL